MTASAIDHCLGAPVAPDPSETVAQWWPGHRVRAAQWMRPIDAAIAGGFAGDRVAWAMASGHQASLRALDPSLPDDRIAAFSVTEENGNRPKDIRTTIVPDPHDGRLTVTGTKRWATLGAQSGVLLVAGTLAAGDRPAIRIVRVPADAAGVQVVPMPATRFVPEIAHAEVRLSAVTLPADAMLPGDGYDRYVKPFRTIEDAHINAAVLAYLVREARVRDWSRAWIARAAAVLAAYVQVAQRDASDATTHVILAGALDAGRALIDETAPWWGDDAAAQRWRRDAGLFGVASTARELRVQRAWERLGVSRPRAA